MIFTDGKCKFLNGSDVCTLHKRKCSSSLCIYKINDDLIGGAGMNYCEICKYRHTWDCEDEIETGRTECKDFKIDLSSDKAETMILRLLAMFEKEEN